MPRSRTTPRAAMALATAAILALAALAATPAAAVQEPAAEPMHALVLAPAGFVATPSPEPLAAIAGELAPATLSAIQSFQADHGGSWNVFVDRRSGAVSLVEGSGTPWVGPGGATLADLETRARTMVDRYSGMFGVASGDLALDPDASFNFGEQGQFWNLTFRQTVGGVPVSGSAVVFRVGHGNLVQFGVNRVYNDPAALAATAPSLDATAARAALAAYVGGFVGGDELLGSALEWTLAGTADEIGYSGAVGGGWTPHLVWRTTFLRPGSSASWEALVDATDGSILRFTDATDYVSVLKASVYPETNCADPTDCVAGSTPEVPVTMPNANLLFNDGSSGFTNSAGGFDYPPGAVAATSDLSGRYFTTVDGCGPITVTSQGLAGDLDAGTTRNVPAGPLNTDCTPANSQSDPDSGPLFGGPGDTHAARSAYYHLNLINQKSRFYLPHNDWLRGIDGNAGPTNLLTNIAPVCNAFWQGGTQTLAFFKQTPGLQCNNTGEIAGVFLHEFGHGLDNHDGTGTAPESATGEAMGDTFALLQTQSSCVGPGFRLVDPLDPGWGAAAGYGTGSRLCSGVRDMDYTRFCRRGANGQCAAPTDPDEVNGSRSGPNPPAEPAGEFGTPARWDTMLSGTAGADGKSNFYNCGGPETTGCAGPLNHGCHCESLIASQSNWDLAKALITAEFGGSPYGPQGPVEVSGWQYMDRLWYLTRDLAISGYSVTGQFPTGTTNGCTATDWFSTYRFIDDDNGDLADGTPHADLLFDAFDLHATACGAAGDPSNQATLCPPPVAAPTLSASCSTVPVQLNWTASAGASRYRVLRNTLGCGFGFTPLDTVSGNRTYFEDAEVAPGVTYYYTVQPVGASPSCYGFASNCLAIETSECAAPALPAPAAVTATASDDNEVTVGWNAVAGASSYKVLRREGGCDANDAGEAVGVVAAPSTGFVDRDEITGGLTYGYRVAASDSSCPSCTSEPSACVEVEATGACSLTPAFAGVRSVSSATDGTCQLTAGWDAGDARCGSGLSYSVYRSTDSNFLPNAGSLVASGLSGTSYADFGVDPDTRYFYIVRATDGFGNSDANTVRRYEVPVGATSPGSFGDDAGDTGAASFIASFVPPGTWAVRSSDTNNATRTYATTAAGNYPDESCNGLESPTLRLGADPDLAFRTRYAIEQGWDGGIVQVATEASGFSDWTRLDSVAYPGLMTGPLGDPACNIPEFADLEPVFTGTSGGLWEANGGSLAAWAGQNVRVRFLFSSDAATNDEGWFVDDLSVDDVRVAASCTERVNTPPEAVDDSATTEQDTPVTIAVLANDTDADGDTLSISAVGTPANGSAADDGDGTVTYTPNAGFHGEDSFTYTADDGNGGSDTATVTVTVTEDTDPGVCGEVDDADATVSYKSGWHRRADARASNGGYHRRMGANNGNGNGSTPIAKVVFQGDEITYFYVMSDRGGIADIYIDGVLQEALSYGAGLPGKENPTFGHSRTYSGHGPGSHELVIEHRTGAVYIDGFGYSCDDPDAGGDAGAAEYASETTVSDGSASEGPVVVRTVDVGSLTEEVSVVVEGSLVPVTVQVLGPAGNLLASGGALVTGGAVSGLDVAVSAPGTYTVKVLNTLGAFSKIEISTAKTVRIE